MSNRQRMVSYRPWGSTEDGSIEFESMTSETLEGALDILRDSFFPDESICTAVEIMSEPGAMSELEKLCIDASRDGVSIVAIEVDTGKVIGAAFNKIQVRGKPGEKGGFEIFAENCKYKSSKELMDFMIDVDARLDLFKHYNVDCILEIMFLSCSRNHRRRRIAELLVSSSIEVGKQLKNGKNVKTPVEIDGNNTITNFDCIPSLASAIMSSNYSQRIAEKLGFDNLIEVSHDDYIYEGKTYQERIKSIHRTSTLVAKKL